MDDLISRQAAIDTLNYGAELLNRVLDATDIVGVERAKYEWGLGLIESCISDIKELPSAEPERKKGKWNTDKESPEYATCSVCGHCDWDCTESEYFNYCPNCGAEMKGEADG